MHGVEYPEDFSKFLIGEKYPVLKTENPNTNSLAALSLISQARRTIDLFTQNLDPRILDRVEIATAIKQFVKISPNSRLRILLCDPSHVVKRGHSLIELSRRFSSFISIRQTNSDYETKAYSLLMVDKSALLFRHNASEYHGIVDYNAAYDCRRHLAFFNDAWERSEPVSELRQLFV